MTFKVGDKVTSEAFGDGVVVRYDYDDAAGYPWFVEFDNGESEHYTIDGCYWYEQEGREPHKNIKHKETQGMNKSDLKTGMVVEYRDGCSRVVLADVGLLVGCAWAALEYFKSDLKHNTETKMDIMKIYSAPSINTDYINTSLKYRKLLWQREEVKEIPLNEAEVLLKAHLGYTVKVVGGE